MFITYLKKRLRKISTKQLIIASAFIVALAGAASLGHATKQESHAADCTPNSIIMCGAANPGDFAAKYNANEKGDLAAIYARYGLQSSDLNKFVTSAKMGVAMKNGDIVVDGRVVATNGVSLGRDANSHYAQTVVNINGNNYYESRAQDVFLSDSIPVMVMFNDKGVMQFAAMTVCGNPTKGNNVVPNWSCNELHQTAVQGKANTYTYSTDASAGNGAAIDHVVYDFGDGSATVTKTSATDQVTHTYTKAGNFTAKVTVYVSVPGGNTQIIAPAGSCTKPVTVVMPYFQCVQLAASVLNDQKTKFRFTVTTKQGNGATLKDVDFTIDSNTTKGVTTKDAQGNIYTDHSFTDTIEHTIVASVNFNVEGGVKSVTCQTKVTPSKTPMCTVPGKEMYPPNAPECVENCTVPGKTNLPVNSPECQETPVPVATTLPNTGTGDIFGIFAGTSAAGAAAHRVFTSRRRRNQRDQ